jgi:small subunit ribosomal protein S20
MPNIKSAEKRVRQIAKRRLLNRYKLVTTRNEMKKLLAQTEGEAAQAMMPRVASLLDRLAKHKIIHKNNAANQKGRLARFINDLITPKAVVQVVTKKARTTKATTTAKAASKASVKASAKAAASKSGIKGSRSTGK